MPATKSWQMASHLTNSNDWFEPLAIIFIHPRLANISAHRAHSRSYYFPMPRWQTLPERKVYRGQSTEHWPFGKWPVTVLWVFKPFYDTPAPDARNLPIMSDLKHVGRAAWPLLIRHVERANQTLVRPRSAIPCIGIWPSVCLFSFARIMRPKLKWKW